MLKITCEESKREQIANILLDELVMMNIRGASLPSDKESKEIAKKFIQSIDELEVKIVEDGVYTKMQSSEETATLMAEELTGDCEYMDFYNGCEIEEIANKIITSFPTAIIEGNFEYQGPGYFNVITLTTVDGRIVIQNSEEDGEYDL